jgi:hypothetical protein
LQTLKRAMVAKWNSLLFSRSRKVDERNEISTQVVLGHGNYDGSRSGFHDSECERSVKRDARRCHGQKKREDDRLLRIMISQG